MNIKINAIDLTLPRPAKAGSYIGELEAAHRERRLRMSKSLLATPSVPDRTNTEEPALETRDNTDKKEDGDTSGVFIKHEGPLPIARLTFVTCTRKNVHNEELLAEVMTSRARMAYYIVCFLSAYHSKAESHEIGLALGGKSAERIVADTSRAKTLVRVDQTIALDVVTLEHDLGLVRWGERSKYTEQEGPASTPGKPKEWWEHFIPVSGPVKFEIMLRETCLVRKISRHEILSERRERELVHARQLLCLLAKRHTKRSLPEIGRLIGGRDHTTVLHSMRKAEQLILDDAEFASDVAFVEHRLGLVRWGDKS